MKKIEMIGKTFGELTVTEEIGVAEGRRRIKLRCLCSCGVDAIVSGEDLRGGHTKSCGHLRSIVSYKKATTHGLSKTKTYISWVDMRKRCCDPKNISYQRYGGRGITVCERWANNFEHFLLDMGEKPTKAHQIDRINNEGNYEPGNCRWALPTENTRNSTVCKLTVDKVRWIKRLLSEGKLNRRQLAKIYGVSRHTIYTIDVCKTWKDVEAWPYHRCRNVGL